MRIWTLNILMLLAVPAFAEHAGGYGLTGGGRATADATAKKFSDAVNACLVGRPASGLSRGVSSGGTGGLGASLGGGYYGLRVPQSPPLVTPEFLSSLPPVEEKSPYPEEDPRSNPDFPGEKEYQSCLKKIPTDLEISCIQTIGSCSAETVDDGKTPIRAITVVAGTPCAAEAKLFATACGRGISPEKFKEGDIKCGAAQF